MDTASPSSGNRLRAFLLIVLVFVLGAASGIGGGLLVLQRLMQRSFAGDFVKNGPGEILAATLENQIASEVDMTPAERAAAKQEVEASLVKFKELRMRMRGDVRDIVKDTLLRVESRLPPEKRDKLRERVTARLQPWGLMP